MVKFKDLLRPLSVFPVLFKANLIFKDFSRQSCIFKYFSSLCEPCTCWLWNGYSIQCHTFHEYRWIYHWTYALVKPVLSGHQKRRPKIGFQDWLSLNAGQKYCRMLSRSILQYFPPSFTSTICLRPLFCLFLSGRLRQVLLYAIIRTKHCFTMY